MKKKIYDYFVEWDDRKNEVNFGKHGISFETAAYVFNDADRIEYYDTAHNEFEDRYCTIGKVGDILFVVYAERGNVLRLISARRATIREEGLYYGNR